jgi:hypothetical protein
LGSNLKEREREEKEGGSGRKRKKDRGFWAKRPFLPPPIQNRGGPTGRPAWGSPAVLPALAVAQERGKREKVEGIPPPRSPRALVDHGWPSVAARWLRDAAAVDCGGGGWAARWVQSSLLGEVWAVEGGGAGLL